MQRKDSISAGSNFWRGSVLPMWFLLFCIVPPNCALAFDKTAPRFPELGTSKGPIKSGRSIKEALAGMIDLLLTDMPMTDEEIRQVQRNQGARLIHIATAVTGVVPCYYIPEISAELRFSSATIAGILRGKISRWNDPAIASINRSVKLPDASIILVGHSVEDGSTYALSDFLSKTNEDWRKSVGRVRRLAVPVLIHGTNYPEIAERVKQTPYSFSYLELWAAKNGALSVGSVKNGSGNYIEASSISLRSAAEHTAPKALNDTRRSIAASHGREDYPIASFTWVVVSDKIPATEKRSEIVSFLTWLLKNGQDTPESMFYGRLPQSIIDREIRMVTAIH